MNKKSGNSVLLALFGSFTLVTTLQILVTIQLVQSFYQSALDSEMQHAHNVFNTYLDVMKAELARAHQGYTWWTEISESLAQLGPGENLPDDLLESWSAGNADNNSLALIAKGGVLRALVGKESGFWGQALKPDEWERIFSRFLRDNSLSQIDFLAREGRLLVVMGCPSCDDSGNVMGTALHLFGLELDEGRLLILDRLSEGKYIHQDGPFNVSSVDEKEVYRLNYIPKIDPQPYFSLSFGSMGVQILLNMVIMTVLMILIQQRTKKLLSSQENAWKLQQNQERAIKTVQIDSDDVENAERYVAKMLDLEELFKKITKHSHTIIENSALVTGQIDDTFDEIKQTEKRIQTISEHIHYTSSNIRDSAHQAQEMMTVVENLQKKVIQFEDVANELNQNALEGLVSLRENVTGIKAVGQASQRVLEILKVINDISDRTHLLAINAAIEASRAGSHGKGFSVVASEIRTLSETVAANTREIEGVVQDIFGKINQAVSNTQMLGTIFDTIADRSEENLQFVESINALMQQQSSFSSQLVAQNNLMAGIIEELETAIKQNVGGLEKIVRSLDDLNKIADQNAQTVEDLDKNDQEILSLLHSIRDLPRRLLAQIRAVLANLEQAP